MADSIRQLYQWTEEQWPGAVIDIADDEMLVRMAVPPNRTQLIRVFSEASKWGEFQILKLQSRACEVDDPQLVRQFVTLNGESQWGGLVLVRSNDRWIADVTYSFVLEHVGFHHLAPALQRIAQLADDIEASVMGSDNF